MTGKTPRNFQGLLRSALICTEKEDAKAPSTFEQMDPEKKKFLEDAMNALRSDVEEIRSAFKIIDAETSTDSDKVDALNYARDFLQNIDCANDTIKNLGLQTILNCLKSTNKKIQVSALYVVSDLAQNNPYAQEHLVDAKVLPILIGLLTGDEDVSAASLHAISAIVRNFSNGCTAFIAIGGIQSLVKCLHSKSPKLFLKATFLIRTLATEHLLVKEKFIQLSVIEKLTECIEAVDGFDVRTEAILSALCVLTECNEGKAKLQRTGIQDEVLSDLIAFNKNRAECEEIVEYAKILLK